MTTNDIIDAIMIRRYARNFVIPNYTPAGWWECDVFEVTKAGFFREYEVKVSRADFFADAAKEKVDWNEYNRTRKERLEAAESGVFLPNECLMNKHARISTKPANGPVQFWYVTPRDLVTTSEIPEWAGLIYLTKNYGEMTVKAAPKLHCARVEEVIMMHAKGACYWRFHNMRAKHFKSTTLAKL